VIVQNRWLPACLLVTLAVFLAACGKDPTPIQAIPTAAPSATLEPLLTPTSQGGSPTTQLVGRTLPPQWTPEPTSTPRPTSTRRPPPTPVPTLNVRQICEKFELFLTPPENAQFPADGTANFGWRDAPPDSTIVVQVILRGPRKDGIQVSAPGAAALLFTLPLRELPSIGDYEWKIYLQHPLHGDFCLHSGTFTRQGGEIF
jgi:hypothetical protein